MGPQNWPVTAAQRTPDTGDDGLGLSVAAVARRLGVAPATLRTWDRRYGLGPSQHTAGAHRRYTAADLERLQLMRRLVLAGISPADAARTVQQEHGADLTRLTGVAGQVDLTDGQIDTADLSGRLGVPGGGRVVPLPGSAPASRGLARAAMSLDASACNQIVSDTLERRGVIWTWDNLLVPVMAGIGERWKATGTGIEVEHLLSSSVTASLMQFAHEVRQPINARPVLLACSDNELHALPLHAVAAGLAERRISSRLLGARVPADALAAAITRTGPAAVLVWSQIHATGDLTQLTTIPEVRPAPVMLAAGPGWHGEQPEGVSKVADLADAINRISAAVGF
jgi:MerR family transcriptional regulator, light-induced transcriptional regulator